MLPAGWAMLATSMQDRTLHLTLGTLVLLAVGGTIILASLRINRLGQMKAR